MRVAARASGAAAPAQQLDRERRAGAADGDPLVGTTPWPRPGAAAAETARVRLVLAIVGLGGLAEGGLAVAFGAERLRVASLLVFCLLGIGSAPWQRNTELRLAARLTLTLLTGLAVLTLVPVGMLAIHEWRPVPAFLVVALVCVRFHLAGLRLATADLRSLQPTRPIVRVNRATLALCGGGAALCMAAALAHRHIDPGFFGFLVKVGPLWYIGLALLVVALVSARGDEEQEMALPVLVIVLVLTLTPAFVYDGPRSQSAAKHVDLIAQIRTQHALVSTFDIYNNWPGFFASIAWLCDIAGISNPMKLAIFWPPLLAGFRIAALRFLFGQLLHGARQCWIAVGLAVLADSIGADYFSPQSVGFLLGLAVFGVALSQLPDSVRLVLVLLAGYVLAMSHQLSPYVVGGVLVVLVIFKQVRPWWMPLLVLGPAVLWAIAHAHALQGFLRLDLIGRAQNFRPPETPGSPGLHRLPVVRDTVVALLSAVAILGSLALVTLVRRWRSRRAWALALCPSVGLVICVLNPYGQEGIFRTVLFGLPWLAALAAGSLPAPSRLLTRIAGVVVAGALTTAFLISSFGLDASNVVRPADVAAYRFFRIQGGFRPPMLHYMLPLGTGDLPNFLPIRREGHQILGRRTIAAPVREQAVPQPDLEMRRLTANFLRYSAEPPTRAQLYAMWSPVQVDYDAAYAVRSPSQATGLRDAFLGSPYWRVVFKRQGTLVFHFLPGRYAARSP